MDSIKVEQARQQWEVAADSIPLLICMVDKEGRIVLSNRTAERWGLGSASAARGRSLHELMHPRCSDGDCYLRKFEQQAVAEFARSRRAQCDAFDPVHQRHFAIRVQPPIRSPEQDDAFAIVMVDDISELKYYEKKMEVLHLAHQRHIAGEVAKRLEAEGIKNRLVSILEKTPNLIAMADADGAFLYLNPAGRALMGVSEDDDLASLTLLNSHAVGARETLAREAIPTARRCGMWSGDSALLARDGSEIPTTQVMIANQDRHGLVAGFSVVEQDMTAWVVAENALRHSQGELQRLSDQLITIQETERQRIAADLHDGLGQSLSLIKLSLEDAARQADESAPGVAEALRRLLPKVKGTLVEVRRISMDLRPSTLDDLGLLATLSWFFREFEEHCRTIKVERDCTIQESEVPGPLKISLFRILQEAVNNIVKHAEATLIRVSLKRDGDLLRMTIEDNGKGFDPAERAIRPTPEGGGLGLRGMKERARLSGGTLTVESAPGEGARINIWWPAPPVEDNPFL